MHMHVTRSGRPVPTPTEKTLVAQLQAEGFRPGCPAHIPEHICRIDAHCCKRLKCAVCRKRSCDYRSFTDGRTYRVLAVCQGCGWADER